METYWATLTRSDENDNLTKIKLFKDTYYFGRSEECDFSFENNFLSQKHCFIERNKSNQKEAYLCDQSSNGTLVNLNEKIHKKKILLKDKDLIYLVYRKNEPKKNIVFKIEFADNAKQETRPTCSKTLDTLNSNSKRELDEEHNNIDKKIKLESDIKENESVETKIIAQTVQDDFTENITCTICNEIMHDCISLQPCLHSYCGGCYSEWMEKSDLCPICRNKVDRIAKNHMINNIIDAYLKNNPHKKRSEDDIKGLNEKNKITHDMLYPKRDGKVDKFIDDYENDEIENEKNNQNQNNDDDSDRGSIFRSENEDEDEEQEEYVAPINIFRYAHPVQGLAYQNFGNQYFHAPVFNNYNQPFRFNCRQCPQNKYLNLAPLAPDYTCAFNQNHLLCQCCLEAFPDRNQEINRNNFLPKQNCSMCFTPYCNLYWGCNKGGCKKCLQKFVDFEPDNDCLNSIINENQYESQLFSDWLVRKNINIKDVFPDCIIKLKNGTYKLSNLNTDDALDKVLCRKCALSLFRELVYQFRSELSATDFFNNQNRPDCHWGKECRTQKHNINHSMKFNHVCERSKP